LPLLVRARRSEQDPSDNVVSNTGREDDDTDLGVEELGGGKNTTEDGEGGDGHRDTDEEDKVAEGHLLRVDKLVVDGHTDSGT
jgi:hypothetical protein